MSETLKKWFCRINPEEKIFTAEVKKTKCRSPTFVLDHAKGMLRPVTKTYSKRYWRYGATPKGVFWSNAANVQQRFDILCQVFFPEDVALGKSSVSDLGCGYGALYDYLEFHPIIRNGEYRGYEICGPLLDACIARVNDPRASFHCAISATRPADYSIVSGTFNLKLGANDEDWLKYIQASLQALWDKTKRAMAFNMLDITNANLVNGLYYADPEIMKIFCQQFLTEDITLITEYGLPDFTIYARR